MTDDPHIPIGSVVEVVAVPYEAQKQHHMLIGYKFRVVDNEWGVYTLSCPVNITFYRDHIELIKE